MPDLASFFHYIINSSFPLFSITKRLLQRFKNQQNICTELCRSVMERSQSLEKIRQITKKLQRLGSLKKTLSFKLRRRSIDQEEEEENQIERRRSESSVPQSHMADYAVKNDRRRSESSVPRGLMADYGVKDDRQRRRRSENSVPRGHLAVYAAKEDCEGGRFVIPVDYLKHPVFKDLLRMAEEEFGFDYFTGLVTIPCDPELFEEIINRLKVSGGVPMTSSYASNFKPYFGNGKTVMVH
ncbi:uncharacterized protein LOC131857416 [Cryptomeria japonica]|uniref:uncharacterized protein LOC131857416 n=1 Tax=Cryptomeria japonica TaxID=3369 RepID=UPI0027DA639B|nr:uncharacterized protein LOC131857416 [Cryptomeria japonica]